MVQGRFCVYGAFFVEVAQAPWRKDFRLTSFNIRNSCKDSQVGLIEEANGGPLFVEHDCLPRAVFYAQ
jgi:hypothetical protein